MHFLIHKGPSLASALEVPRGVTALVGGGGKTTLMFCLAEELARTHRVIVATTTHVMRPAHMPVLVDPALDNIRSALAVHSAVFIGRVASHDKMAASGVDVEQLMELADYILIEADGAKGKPLKAPAFYEPVIPACTSLVIAVAGLDGVGQTISEAAHRPALFADALETTESQVVSPADLARIVTDDDGQRRGVTASMRFAVVLNKADNAVRLAYGKACAANIDPARAERVLITSLKQEAVPC